MKVLKNILGLTLTSLLFVTCTDNFMSSTSGKPDEGKKVTFRFSVKAADNKVVSRTLNYEDNSIKDLNVFVFDQQGDLQGFRYIDTPRAPIEGQTIFDMEGKVGIYQFAIITNVYDNISDDINTLTELLQKVNILTNDIDSERSAIMSVLTPFYTITDPYKENESWIAPIPGTSGTPILLERRTAKVTVAFNTAGLNPDVKLEIESVSLKQVPKTFTYLTDPANPVVATSVGDGDYINSIDGNVIPPGTTLEEKHNNATPLYLMENLQGEKRVDNTTDPDYTYTYYKYDPYPTQIPVSETRYSSPRSMVPHNGEEFCSYLEIVASYNSINVSSGNFVGEEGVIVYKIYLGTNLSGNKWNDFNVWGNTWYKVTVNLTGKGGIDEVNWRIDTEELMRYGPGLPEDAYYFSYTIHPADALFWLSDEYPSPPVFNGEVWMSTPLAPSYVFGDNNGMLSQTEYYEGRYITYLMYISGNSINGFPAMTACRNQNYPLNSAPSKDMDVNNVKTYLPAQNELQMVNIFNRDAIINSGAYWTSTQLLEGSLQGNNHWARVVNFSLRGQAYTTLKREPALVRCLRSPEGYRNNPKFTYNGAAWDQKIYPYLSKEYGEQVPVIVNREEKNGITRGLKLVSIRTGAPYSHLTPKYHTVRRIYEKYRVARWDCGPDGSRVTTPTYMDWYTAMGYTSAQYGTPGDITPAMPPANPEHVGYTGCRAYYEDNDRSQIGKWRVPTSLELQQMWIMGASIQGQMPANPAIPYTTFVNDPNAPGNRLPAMHQYYSSFTPMTGSIDALKYIVRQEFNPGKDINTILDDVYWSATTTMELDNTTLYDNGKYAYKQDFYSGDGYSGMGNNLVAPDKKKLGKVRCVMDVYP